HSSLLFFFSSRRRHTRFSRDWSSDMCSSDLEYRLSAACRSATCRRPWAPRPPHAPRTRTRAAAGSAALARRRCLRKSRWPPRALRPKYAAHRVRRAALVCASLLPFDHETSTPPDFILMASSLASLPLQRLSGRRAAPIFADFVVEDAALAIDVVEVLADLQARAAHVVRVAAEARQRELVDQAQRMERCGTEPAAFGIRREPAHAVLRDDQGHCGGRVNQRLCAHAGEAMPALEQRAQLLRGIADIRH